MGEREVGKENQNSDFGCSWNQLQKKNIKPRHLFYFTGWTLNNMSMSRQFASIGLQPKQRKQRPQKVTAVTTVTKQVQAAAPRAQVQRQIPRGFVTALAADSKYFDQGSGAPISSVLNTTGAVLHLDVITQGDAVTQRSGKSFQLTNFQIRGFLSNNATSVINHVAVYLVWDRQPNKVLFGVTDFLDQVASTGASMFAKRENKGRFLTIKKWQRVLIGQGLAGVPVTGREAIVIDKWIRLPAECIAQCTATDTTGAIGNRITGALALVTIGNVIAGTAAATLNFNFRVGFRDPQ